MKRGQVFVRAETPSGRWVAADALNLTQESFNAFVLDILYRAGAVIGIAFKDEFVEGPELRYKTVGDGEHGEAA